MKYKKQALKLLNNVIKENELLLLTLTHEDRDERIRQWANNAMEWAIDKEKKELEENILLEEKKNEQSESKEILYPLYPTSNEILLFIVVLSIFYLSIFLYVYLK